MAAFTIRRSRKEVLKFQRRVYDGLRQQAAATVTVVWDCHAQKVLGVLVDRNSFPKFQGKCAVEGLDISHGELLDFPLTV